MVQSKSVNYTCTMLSNLSISLSSWAWAFPGFINAQVNVGQTIRLRLTVHTWRAAAP